MAFVRVDTFIVPNDHPCLPGHFPGQPVVPGVLILQEVAARIGVLWMGARLAEVTQVKFQSPLLPGEPCTLFFDDTDARRVRFECRVDDRLIASGAVLTEDRT